jgi:foldase protein PrsA
MTRRLPSFAALALVVLLSTGCGDLLDPAAAVVDGHKITTQEVAAELDHFESTPEYQELIETAQDGPDDPDEAVGALRRQYEQGVLTALIRRAVIRPLAAERGIEITDGDVDAALEEILQDFMPADVEDPEEAREAALEEFQKRVASQGLTPTSVMEIIRDNETEEALRAEVAETVDVGEEEAREYYDAHIGDYTETRAAHILVSDRGQAVELKEQLDAAPAKKLDALFARLAERHSEDAQSGAAGGDLGFQAAGTFVPEFEQALAGLEEGDISDPVRTEFGFHIIRAVERRTTPFEEASIEILDQLVLEAQDQAWMDFIKDAYRDADIRVNGRYGRLDIARQLVVDVEAGEVPGTVEVTPTPTPSPLQPIDAPEG